MIPLIFVVGGGIFLYRSLKKEETKTSKTFDNLFSLTGILPCNNDCANCKHYKNCNDWELCNEDCVNCEEKETCQEQINKFRS